MRGGRENQRWTAEPDVRLRIGALRTNTVVDILRAHIEPAHVDIGMQRLEAVLEERQQVAAVRAVDDEGSAVIARAAAEQDRSRYQQLTEHSAA